MKYLINDSVIDISKVSTKEHYHIRYLFGGNTSSIFVSKNYSGQSLEEIISNTRGSEHWLTENSDYFRFDNDGNLHTLFLNVPQLNFILDYKLKNCETTYQINCKANLPSIIPCQKYRNLNSESKFLVVFSEEIGFQLPETIFQLNLCDDFSLLFKDNKYEGFSLNDPLKYLTVSISDDLTPEATSNNEYVTFQKYLKIMSDNNLEDNGGDMELIVQQLKNEVKNEVSLITSPDRRKLLMNSINDLIDFFKKWKYR